VQAAAGRGDTEGAVGAGQDIGPNAEGRSQVNGVVAAQGLRLGQDRGLVDQFGRDRDDRHLREQAPAGDQQVLGLLTSDPTATLTGCQRCGPLYGGEHDRRKPIGGIPHLSCPVRAGLGDQ